MKIKSHISSFFLLWFTVVSISIFTAIWLATLLGDFIFRHNGRSYSASNDGDFEFFLSILLLVGLFTGFGQWIVIRTKIKIAYSWILATLIGFSIGSFVSFQILTLLPTFDDKYYMIYGAIQFVGTLAGAGMFTGLCQWVSLKRKIAGSLKWSLVNSMSFAIFGLSLMLGPGYLGTISIIISIVLTPLISGYFVEPLIISPEIENFTRQEIAI